ncbi:MAG: hypothetical protein ACI3Z7_03960 [Candidatus Aphodosoma sp.]
MARCVFAVAVLSLFVFCISAQTIELPYFNGWEDETENVQWIINDGLFDETVAPNRWYVSAKESFNGRHSLLVSDLSLAGGDTSAVYSNHVVNIVAARRMTLPKGTYDLSYAWKCYGEEGADGLYVAWIDPMSDIKTSISRVHDWVQDAQPYKGRMFCGSSSWKVNKTTVVSTGTQMLLCFLWVNNKKNSAALSCCIDDIQIAKVSDCGAPSGIRHNVVGNDVSLTWNANNNAVYEVRYTSEYAGVNDTVKNVRGGSVVLPGLADGMYNFYVRTICGAESDTSIWYEHLGVIVNADLCLDYTNLEGNGVTCYLGASPQNPFGEIRIDRDGIDGAPSRHTVNTDVSERDPMTGGALSAIPQGDFASVRLGNWDVARSEAIDYTLHLDSGVKVVLVMKYAVVLEVPDGHSDDMMPKFRLELMDGAGESAGLLDEECGKIDFFADMDLVGSNGWSVADIDRPTVVIYKDWTTLGVNLSEYAENGARDIHVRLSAYDCGHRAHFGYAYFTLSCTSGDIQGVSCGGLQSDEIVAPEGFRYHWYRTYDPDVPVYGADERKLHIDNNDTATYSCKVMSLETDCYFTLTASLLPRYPKPKIDVLWDPVNCQNAVRFDNKSRVETLDGVVLPEPVESFEWTLDDGSVSKEKSLRIPVPNEGGDVHVKLKAVMSGGACWEELDTMVRVRPIQDVFDTSYVSLCKGRTLTIAGVVYSEAGDYPLASVKSFSGCDSTHVMHVDVVDKYEICIDTAICYGDTLKIGTGRYYFSSDEMPDGVFVERLLSSGGCDSTIRFHLDVLPPVTFNCEVRNVTDGPNSGGIIITDTLPGTYYSVNGEINGRIDSLAVGTYEIVCYNRLDCAGDTVTVYIQSECAEVEIGDAGMICGTGDEYFFIPVNVRSGSIPYCNLKFGDLAGNEGFEDVDSLPLENSALKVSVPCTVKPDRYAVTLEMMDMACGKQIVEYEFDVLYPSDIIRQKWNDVLALTNEMYNGGYEFSAYQWYKDGAAIPGASSPYFYVGPGMTLDTDAEYCVELTRSDDGVTLMSCPVVPEIRGDFASCPVLLETNVVRANAKVEIKNVSETLLVDIYDVNGRFYGRKNIGIDNPCFEAPALEGVYIVVVDRHPLKIIVIP